ncbi:hypothetical protein [Reichenbachiella sp.]|uniref:hypothetical protein n=1 Tax=Reichenbachiella sp. TaxID=2184521 RepID=UPI0032970A60
MWRTKLKSYTNLKKVNILAILKLPFLFPQTTKAQPQGQALIGNLFENLTPFSEDGIS